MPRPVLGAKIPPPRSTHDLAQQKRQNRRTTLPHTPDCTPAPHLHSQQAVWAGNASATANNIAAHETLFRLGILSDLFTATMAIFLTLALYRLFKGVDQGLARLVVILGALMLPPIYFLTTINNPPPLLPSPAPASPH